MGLFLLLLLFETWFKKLSFMLSGCYVTNFTNFLSSSPSSIKRVMMLKLIPFSCDFCRAKERSE